jgi:hypothetical protein
MTRRAGSLAAAVVLSLGLLAGLAGVPAAQAVTGSPPVTTPDVATVYPGNVASVFPVNNDHDPDNDELAVCRIGTERYKGFEAEFFGNELAVFAGPGVAPGAYTFTYYACDYTYLTPGTVTVTVAEPPRIKVQKVEARPGMLRVTNPADFTIRFLYGSFREGRPDGSLIIRKGESAVVRVHRSRIDWVASNRRGDISLGTGRVLNIRLPAGDHPPTVGRADLPARLVGPWRTA